MSRLCHDNKTARRASVPNSRFVAMVGRRWSRCGSGTQSCGQPLMMSNLQTLLIVWTGLPRAPALVTHTASAHRPRRGLQPPAPSSSPPCSRPTPEPPQHTSTAAAAATATAAAAAAPTTVITAAAASTQHIHCHFALMQSSCCALAVPRQPRRGRPCRPPLCPRRTGRTAVLTCRPRAPRSSAVTVALWRLKRLP